VGGFCGSTLIKQFFSTPLLLSQICGSTLVIELWIAI
jgi:hypothetical protein